jgi:hypothetical protein
MPLLRLLSAAVRPGGQILDRIRPQKGAARPRLQRATATRRCKAALQRGTATRHCNATLQRGTATRHCKAALQRGTATRHCNAALQRGQDADELDRGSSLDARLQIVHPTSSPQRLILPDACPTGSRAMV